MVLGELIAWMRDSVKFVIEHAPYPLKAGIWLFAFFTFAGIMSVFFSMSVSCTTDSEAYTPDSPYWAMRTEFKRIALSNNLNYTLVDEFNQSIDYDEPGLWTRVYGAVWFVLSTGGTSTYDTETETLIVDVPGNMTVNQQYLMYHNIVEAQKYNEFVREHATLQETEGDEGIVGTICDHEYSKLTMFGINVMDKTLWLVLAIFVVLGPYLAMALKRRT